jgi:hypothetical protein
MSWGSDSKTPAVDWSMSASLLNVVREGEDMAEVTSLRQAVEAWRKLEPDHRLAAVLTPDRPVLIDGVQHDRFEGEGIETLAELLE